MDQTIYANVAADEWELTVMIGGLPHRFTTPEWLIAFLDMGDA